ncbi:MAG: hypothetical protein HYV60_22080 [Planctomycetia bacterium]|nr:hypothetical protein [Planctomycetia bacterium]
MSPQDQGGEISTKIESAVRHALNEIQRGGILCVPNSLAQRQLEGAVRIVMRQLAREWPELVTDAHQVQDEATVAKQGDQE